MRDTVDRTVRALVAAAALLLAVAGPAAAWDSVEITISPPAGGTTAGSAGGPPVTGNSGDVIDMLLMSSATDARPAGDLGPRFEVTYTYPGGVLSQDLYPYAPGGPVAFSATGGSIVGHAVQAGWHAGNASTLSTFVSWGLPDHSVAQPSDRTAVGPAGIALGVVPALLAVALVAGLGLAFGLPRLAALARVRIRRTA